MPEDLKPPLKGYALWLLPTDEDGKEMNELIASLGDTMKDFGAHTALAHITLIGLLDWQAERLSQLRNNTHAIAESFDPFVATATGVGVLHKYLQSVFLPVVPSEPIVGMNIAARELFVRRNDPQFFPHFSLVYGDINSQTKKEIRGQALKSLEFPLDVRITHLGILDATGLPEEWNILEKFELGKK